MRLQVSTPVTLFHIFQILTHLHHVKTVCFSSHQSSLADKRPQDYSKSSDIARRKAEEKEEKECREKLT